MDNHGYSFDLDDTEEPVMTEDEATFSRNSCYEMNLVNGNWFDDEKENEYTVENEEKPGTSSQDKSSPAAPEEPVVEVEEEDVNHEGLSLTKHLLSSWYILLVFLLPLVLLPLALSIGEPYQNQARCAYVIIIMAVFWTTEVFPLSVTSLLPVVLLPALGVMRAHDVSAQYFNDTSMLFVGGLVVAIAVEVWDVHRRIALLVLKIVGAEPKRLLLGIILVSWFLSMWISNTATAAMMMTIVHALLQQFKRVGNEGHVTKRSSDLQLNGEAGYHVGTETEEAPERDRAEEDDQYVRLKKAISLAVAYSANIGGIGSLTGTGPNLVFFAASNQLFRQYGLRSPVSFATWLVFGLPLSLIAVIIMWAWLIFFYLRCRGCCGRCGCGEKDDAETIKRVQEMIAQEYIKMGPVTFAQGSVLTCFVTLVLAWITRNLGGGGGWGDWFPEGFVSDSTPSTLAAILLFVLPSTLPAIFTKDFHNNRPAGYSSIKPLLTWQPVHEKMPWNIYLLLGGGFAIAVASERSGLSAWVGERLLVLQDLNNWAILVIICYITVFATEVTSNTAVATLLMPILSQMAISLRVNPLFFMFPATISSSFAFMLPVATPPNAIVFSYGDIKVIDMVKTGIFLNAACVPLLLFATATWGNAFFDLETNPAAFLGNITATTSTTTTISPVVTVS
ncbi:hypothetical protein RRG08_004649 [Elysia crispata]|uniref:Solute carrier family 13 member 5 n=1 Tax=Elysia crispata TaxID=231223 RepID=A0AAE0ZF00_9GAST|nr:hypothetical protein RRG08_004649 [Elysia crispata]